MSYAVPEVPWIVFFHALHALHSLSSTLPLSFHSRSLLLPLSPINTAPNKYIPIHTFTNKEGTTNHINSNLRQHKQTAQHTPLFTHTHTNQDPVMADPGSQPPGIDIGMRVEVSRSAGTWATSAMSVRPHSPPDDGSVSNSTCPEVKTAVSSRVNATLTARPCMVSLSVLLKLTSSSTALLLLEHR
jgi:hypothetical protein